MPADTAIRDFMYALIKIDGVRSIVDIGCGSGDDLLEIGRLRSDAVRLIGLDLSESAIKNASAGARDDPRFAFAVADVNHGLPLALDSADVVISKNVLECVVDKDEHIKEIHRVLRDGGQVVCAHYDWDSQAIDGVDKSLVRRIVHEFGDWKQAWMTDCDAWMGRRLWRTFQRSGLFEGQIEAKTLTETKFTPGAYGYETIRSFEALARRGIISQDDFDAFYKSIEALAACGEYFYSINMYAYAGRPI